VLHGLASFEEAPPTVDEMGRRRDEIVARGLPYLVAEQDGRVVGYCYASPFRMRSAYRFTLEDSIYIDAAEVGRGIGRALLEPLLARSAELGYRQMVAVIGGSDSVPSIRLHERLGFARTGLLPAIGFKFGQWVDTVLMQRALGPGAATPPQ
jgi:L-amino acid N-acyltransferase YncA